MRRAMRSLSGQLILLVVAALVVAQVISLFLFADERSLAIRAALGFEAAGRAANVARLIEEAPLDLQDSILRNCCIEIGDDSGWKQSQIVGLLILLF